MRHVRGKRMVRIRVAELRDHLRQPADVGRHARRLAELHGCGPPVQVARAVHQLEEEVAHIHRPRKRAQLVNERLGAFGRPRAHPERGDLVAGIAQHAQHRDDVAALRPVVEPVPTDDHMRQPLGGEGRRDRGRDRVGAAEHRDLRKGYA